MYPIVHYRSPESTSNKNLNIASGLRAQGKYQAALSVLMLSGTYTEGQTKIDLEICRSYLQKKEIDIVISILKKYNSISALSSMDKVLLNEYKGIIRDLKGIVGYKAVKDFYEILLELNPEDIKLLSILARESEQEGDSESASSLYERVLKFAPCQWDAITFTCAYLIQKGDTRRAKNRLIHVSGRAGKARKSKILNMLGGIYLLEDNPIEAEKCFIESFRISPGNGPAVLGKIKCAFWSKTKQTDRLSILNKAIQEMHNDPQGIISLSCLLIQIVGTDYPLFKVIEAIFPEGSGIKYSELLQKLSENKGNRLAIEKIETFYIDKLNVFNSVYKPIPADKNAWIGMYKPDSEDYQSPV